MDIEDIRENYRRLDDWRIEKLATDDPNSLRPEALAILKDEIRRRNLKPGFISSVDIMMRDISKEEFDEYCSIVRNHSCPICSSSGKKLNATVIGIVQSIIVISNFDKLTRIGCKDCLDKAHRNADIKSALLGWWAFPWGPIKTFKAFDLNSKKKIEYHSNHVSPTLEAFVRRNIGVLAVAKDNPEELTSLLKHTNRS